MLLVIGIVMLVLGLGAILTHREPMWLAVGIVLFILGLALVYQRVGDEDINSTLGVLLTAVQ